MIKGLNDRTRCMDRIDNRALISNGMKRYGHLDKDHGMIVLRNNSGIRLLKIIIDDKDDDSVG